MILKQNKKGTDIMLGTILACLSFNIFLENVGFGSNVSFVHFLIGMLCGLSFTLSVAYVIRTISSSREDEQYYNHLNEV
ncbi:MAG: hypothetical protein JW891_13460 [Candidatus Lokiarchaeota archaeon]|nr:hypothetical protein [Candidatus Lokiarchaeota archaeon]